MLLVLVLVASVVVAVISVRQSFPEEAGRVTLDGLSRPVEVRRDEWGIPQIYADSSNDLFFAQGYVHAQDRFFEMDFRRHLGSGQLSEWFGADQLETDKFLRTLGWRHVAEKEFENLSPETRRFLEAYASGVNEYLKGRSGSRISVEYSMGVLGPGEKPRPWEPVDSLVWLKAMAWDLRGNMEDEIARVIASSKLSPDQIAELYPEYPYDRNPPIVPNIAARNAAKAGKDKAGNGKSEKGRAENGEQAKRKSPGRAVPDLPEDAADAMAGVRDVLEDVPSPMAPTGSGDGAADGRAGIGSNSWVVSGSRTTSGKPLLANDPHLSAQVPSIWYQMGLHCRKQSAVCPFDVSGFTFAGMPGVVIGHNDRIGWGFTNLGADVTDLFLERIDGNSYLFDGERLPLEIRREVIVVKGAEPVELNVRSTQHGPLLSDVDDQLGRIADDAPESKASPPGGLETGVSLRWTALDAGRTADALFQMNAASNWKEFRTAAKRFDVPAQNLVYADVDGHIGYQAPGRIPVRRGGTGEWPMPGWTSSYGWDGYVPFGELPSDFDPPEGYIVTANNAVTGPSYEPRLADHWSYGYRSGRIVDLVAGAGKLDVAAMSKIQLDTRNGFASTLVPYLLRIRGLDEFTLEGRETLVDWNYQQDVDSAGAAYFNAAWKNLLGMTFHDQLAGSARPAGGDRWYEVVRRLLEEPDSEWWDDKRTKRVREDRDAILAKALKQARLDLTAKLSKDPERWRWGRLHQLELRSQTFGQSGIGLLEALFNRGPYELSGGSDAVLAAGWNTASDDYDVGTLPSMRMVVDLSDLDRSRWINLTGTSGHPWSEHYDDQVRLWVDGKTTAWPFGEDAVRRRTVDTLTLVPVAWS